MAIAFSTLFCLIYLKIIDVYILFLYGIVKFLNRMFLNMIKGLNIVLILILIHVIPIKSFKGEVSGVSKLLWHSKDKR